MADALADGKLAAILHDLRVERKWSYGRIARDLFATYSIDVTAQTVANWCDALAIQAAS